MVRALSGESKLGGRGDGGGGDSQMKGAGMLVGKFKHPKGDQSTYF